MGAFLSHDLEDGLPDAHANALLPFYLAYLRKMSLSSVDEVNYRYVTKVLPEIEKVVAENWKFEPAK